MQGLSDSEKLKLGMAVISITEKVSEILGFNQDMEKEKLHWIKSELSSGYLHFALQGFALGRFKSVEDAAAKDSIYEFLQHIDDYCKSYFPNQKGSNTHV